MKRSISCPDLSINAKKTARAVSFRLPTELPSILSRQLQNSAEDDKKEKEELKQFWTGLPRTAHVVCKLCHFKWLVYEHKSYVSVCRPFFILFSTVMIVAIIQ